MNSEKMRLRQHRVVDEMRTLNRLLLEMEKGIDRLEEGRDAIIHSLNSTDDLEDVVLELIKEFDPKGPQTQIYEVIAKLISVENCISTCLEKVLRTAEQTLPLKLLSTLTPVSPSTPSSRQRTNSFSRIPLPFSPSKNNNNNNNKNTNSFLYNSNNKNNAQAEDNFAFHRYLGINEHIERVVQCTELLAQLKKCIEDEEDDASGKSERKDDDYESLDPMLRRLNGDEMDLSSNSSGENSPEEAATNNQRSNQCKGLRHIKIQIRKKKQYPSMPASKYMAISLAVEKASQKVDRLLNTFGEAVFNFNKLLQSEL